MNKDKITLILGDILAFVSILILQAHGYSEQEAKGDKEAISKMLGDLCKELDIEDLDIVAITTYANNYMNNQLNGKAKK